MNNKHTVFQGLIRVRLSCELKYCEFFNKSVAPKRISSEGFFALLGIVESHHRHARPTFFGRVNRTKLPSDVGIALCDGYCKYLISSYTRWLTVFRNKEVRQFVWWFFFKELRIFDIHLGLIGFRRSACYCRAFKDWLIW